MTQVRGKDRQQTTLSENNGPYILGLDIGTTSVGWAVIDSRNGKPVGLRLAGVRIFEAGVEGSSDDIARGKDASRAAKRRDKRLQRRQAWRRASRLRRSFAELQRYGLLPDGAYDAESRHDALLKLDAELREKHVPKGDERAAQLLPYLLRSKGVTESLTLLEFGRALFHLAQRRGFRSNRKADRKPEVDADDELVATDESPKKKPKRRSKASDKQTSSKALNTEQSADELALSGELASSGKEDKVKVKEQIELLKTRMAGRTLGQYFAMCDPLEQRIRQQWTGREMYLHEFEQLWAEQSKHHPQVLTPEAKRVIWKAIFDQRKLKSQKGLVGKCELEPKRRRCAQALPIAQEFRILQSVNHLKLREANGSTRFLDADERQKIIDVLRQQESLTFKAALKLIGNRTATFTQEAGSDDKLIGDRTARKLRPFFGAEWNEFTEAQREEIIYDVLHFQDAKALARRAMRAWKLAPDAAEKLAETQLEPAYARHSKWVLIKLVEQLRLPSSKDPQVGKSYSEAREAAGYGTVKTAAVNQLPPINGPPRPPKPKSDKRKQGRKPSRPVGNPAVSRALTEVRKVVNELIRKFGKPEIIRVELARDLKRSRKDRERMSEENEKQRKSREKAVAEILSLPGLENSDPSAGDKEKWLLATECGWICPFTGTQICRETLIGPQSQFDVAHIFPKRYLDDSQANKTLCLADENRHQMHDLLPAVAYSGNKDRWEEILQRVRRFRGPLAKEKLKRFLMTELPEDREPAQRLLNDTRYSSKLAAEYLALLYGGRSDEGRRLRIQVGTGGITKKLRDAWRLNGILPKASRSASKADTKNREDHRHHAIDAVVIALTSADLVEEASRLAASRRSGWIFANLSEPWTNFVKQLCEVILGIDGVHQAVSHRVNHKLGGQLHDDTLYTRRMTTVEDGKVIEAHHVRKPLFRLTEADINSQTKIVDKRIRELIQEQYRKRKVEGAKNPYDAFNDPQYHPNLTTRTGNQVPIHKVRIRVKANPDQVSPKRPTRLVETKNNHHTVIVATLDSSGNETQWKDYPVTRLRAHERYSENLKSEAVRDIVQRDWGTGQRFKFVLFRNDCIVMKDGKGQERMYRVANISEGDIELKTDSDNRESKVVKKEKEKEKKRIRVGANTLMQREARKVRVTPLGEIVPDE